MTHSDIKTEHWIFRKTPQVWHPYLLLARVDRPIGTWLLLLPGLWSLSLATGGWQGIVVAPFPYLHYIVLFTLGAFLMRSAGCVVNDLWDKQLDRAVERTRNRPLAAGTVSILHSLLFLAGLLIASLFILLQMNLLTDILGVVSVLLVAVYPAMKRLTWWPQAFLGLTFNWGALMGWTALTGTLALPALILYAAGIFWTLGYDTIYAHQDKEDDALIGIKSTARLFAGRSPLYVAAFYLLTTMLVITAKLAAGPVSAPAWAAMAALAAHFTWQVHGWNMDDAADCLTRFKSNRHAGLIILLICLL